MMGAIRGQMGVGLSTIRDLIKQKMHELGYNKATIASECGISREQITNFLNGKKEMESKNIDKINKVLKLY